MAVDLGKKVSQFATDKPRLITWTMSIIATTLMLLALLPSIWPNTFSGLNPLLVDTAPENMLPADEPVRVYHNAMKAEMDLHDMVVVGVVNREHPEGVFNPDSLARIYELTEFAKTLRWPDPDDPDRQIGVIPIDIIAPSTVDNITQGEQPGFVNFHWLMSEPPSTLEEALDIRAQAQRIPFLDGTLVSDDGKALALYLPLTSKHLSARVYSALNSKIATFDGPEEYHITGLPVAEDVFGIEMFKQMAISAPLAMLVIFLLMLYFFKKIVLIISPMIIAVVSIVVTMSLLIITGNVIHIMSSMIPIFIMPIAVLDAVHIISEFFDHYPQIKDRRKTIVQVMQELFVPMLYTSITTAVGFGSLALVPIPPVQVFGLFVAFGVLVAWVLTMIFIPAYVMFIKPESLENFGLKVDDHEEDASNLMSRLLRGAGLFTYRRAKLFVIAIIAFAVVSIYGINLITINDNPVKWFTPSHPIRVADRVLNDHFGGTYMAFLTMESQMADESLENFAARLADLTREWESEHSDLVAATAVFAELRESAPALAAESQTPLDLLQALEELADEKLFAVEDDDEYDAWDAAYRLISAEASRSEVFKQPQVLEFIAELQEFMAGTGVVGKSNSLADIVKTVNRELVSGDEADFAIPASSAAVAQTLLQYQNSHRPQDLWHFVTPDFSKSVLWIQLTSGDNQDMMVVVDAIDEFMATAQMPEGYDLEHSWFGLTYINVVWQERMVEGMLQALLGSFVIVFLMMTVLYRSALWGMLSMIPLTVTIASVYAVIGFIGKDYDMPVAVLSSMSLGLAVDYSIHFISRSRAMYLEHRSWKLAVAPMFQAPARAITRNVIVAGVGFLPLLAAPLVPYRTVGFFIASILLSAGLATILILPALITVLEKFLFPQRKGLCILCNCMTVMISTAAAVLAIIVNAGRYIEAGWTVLTAFGVIAVLVMGVIAYLLGRMKQSRMKFPLEPVASPEGGDDERN